MNRKKSTMALVACIVLFVGALAFTLLFEGVSSGGNQGSAPIELSEILPSNRTYPAPNGEFLDYIELHNTTDSPIDISGYMIGDNPVADIQGGKDAGFVTIAVHACKQADNLVLHRVGVLELVHEDIAEPPA